MFSHNAGWTHCLLDQIGSRFGSREEVDIITNPFDIYLYDKIIINEGLNYKGDNVLNLFGGVTDDLDMKLRILGKYKGLLYTFNKELDLTQLCLKRNELNSIVTEDGIEFPEVTTINTQNNGPNIIIGDSHSLSIYRHGYGISRNDGKTLHGALKDNGRFIKDILKGGSYRRIVLYFGNIDMRFHVLRRADTDASIKRLISNYVGVISELLDQGYEVEVQSLLPIEDESRKIPGTGKYQGESFYGTREERQEAVDHFNLQMDQISKYVGFDFVWWDNLPIDGFEAPKFPAMESRQSVHLRPDYYKYKDTFIKDKELKLF